MGSGPTELSDLEREPIRAGKVPAADSAPVHREDPDGGATVQAELEAPDPAVGVGLEPVEESLHGSGLEGDGATVTTGMTGMIDFTEDFAYALGHPLKGPPYGPP